MNLGAKSLSAKRDGDLQIADFVRLCQKYVNEHKFLSKELWLIQGSMLSLCFLLNQHTVMAFPY